MTGRRVGRAVPRVPDAEALNSLAVEALVKLGPPGYEEVEADARKAVAADGGKGLEIDSVKVSHASSFPTKRRARRQGS
ncbi:hypothetical protein [Streptomyces narbonensis]|uniref:hypothetical protein n=1 Tax=Streptomyces narbonensis TaxID=67333 RepID=UPI0033FF1FD0